MGNEKKLILVVDDDTSICKIFKWILEEQGYSVDTAGTGHEALAKASTKAYNLALLDIRLPDMDGTELLSELHKQRPKMVKVMVTGHPSLENSVKSLNLGADTYIIKPVAPEALLKVVRDKLMEQEDAERTSQEQIDEWIAMRIQKLQNEQ